MPKCKSDSGKECCGGRCHESADAKPLGPEAVELAKMFKAVNENLMAALQTRQKIIETVHMRSKQSPEMKAKVDKVIGAQHPVLVQFVFGLDSGCSSESCGHKH